MIKSILLLFLSICTLHYAAQEIEWAIPVPIESHSIDFLPMKAISCSEDRVFVCGPVEHTLAESSNPEYDLLLLSYDYSGQLLDSVFISGEATCLELIYHDGFVFVLGSYVGTLIFDTNHTITSIAKNASTFLAKLSVAGELEWVQNFADGTSPSIVDMAISPEGVIFINEKYASQSTGELKQFDLDGNELDSWLQELTIVSDIVFDPAGYIYQLGADLSGEEMSFNGTPVENPHLFTQFVAKYDLEGNLIYTKIFEIPDVNVGRLLPADNGEVYVAIRPSGPQVIDGFTFEQGHWVNATSIIRLNGQGDILWVRDIGVDLQLEPGDGSSGEGHCLTFRSDDGILIGGAMRQYVDWGNGFVTDYNGGSGFIWGINASGNTDMLITSDGGFSASKLELSTANETDYFAFMTLEDTLTIGGLYLPADNNKRSVLMKWSPGAVGLTEEFNRIKLSIYPNPTSSQLRLLGIDKEVIIYVYDIHGRLMKNHKVQANNAVIATSALHEGQYYIHVIDEDGVNNVLPFVKLDVR